MAKTYIYGLSDPQTGEIRYIGKSANPVKRLGEHIRDNSSTYKVNWIRSLHSRPRLEILEVVDSSVWEEAEIWWIAFAKEMGWRLTNATKGGEGGEWSERRKLEFRIQNLERSIPDQTTYTENKIKKALRLIELYKELLAYESEDQKCYIEQVLEGIRQGERSV